VAGRPALYATTKQFLDDLGLESLDQLPLMESSSPQAGLLDALNDAQESLPDTAQAETPIQHGTEGDAGAGDQLFALSGNQE
jgi:segregation and condensation protein B